VRQIPDAVDTVVCAPDDVWRCYPKRVEHFPDKINCVTLHLVGCILEYYYDARTHEHQSHYFVRAIRATDFFQCNERANPQILLRQSLKKAEIRMFGL
jgi:hypothetical protein